MAQVKADPKAAAARRADGEHITQRTQRVDQNIKQGTEWRKEHALRTRMPSRKEMLS